MDAYCLQVQSKDKEPNDETDRDILLSLSKTTGPRTSGGRCDTVLSKVTRRDRDIRKTRWYFRAGSDGIGVGVDFLRPSCDPLQRPRTTLGRSPVRPESGVLSPRVDTARDGAPVPDRTDYWRVRVRPKRVGFTGSERSLGVRCRWRSSVSGEGWGSGPRRGW